MIKIAAGARIEVQGFALSGGATWEPATISRTTKISLPLPDMLPRSESKWWPVRFSDGRTLLIHETGFRLARAAA